MATTAEAQGPIEAYRFGLKGLHGTARAQSLGGAVGALGADPTAVYVNPAGLGLYSRSTLSISADPGRGKSTVDWQNTHKGVSSYGLGGFSNVAYMTPFFENPSTGYKFSMGVAYNRDYDFDRSYRMNTGVLGAGLADLMMLIGMDEGLSFDKYIDNPNTGYNPFKHMVHPLVAMGANADLIKPLGDNDKLFQHSFLDTYNKETNKWEPLSPDRTMLDVIERGARNSVDINMSMGFGDIFYVGAALRLGTIKHTRLSDYREDFKFVHRETSDERNNYMVLSNDLRTSGTSVGLNLGALVMLGDYIRLGVSYMTPERISLDENYSAKMTTFNEFMKPDKRELTFGTAVYDNSYVLRTPGQFTASVLAFMGQYGFVSYDFQYRDLGTARLYAGDNRVNPLTEVIGEDYGREMTHKFGVEIRPMKRLALRGGMTFTGNPMKGEEFDVEPETGLSRDAVAVGMMPDFTLPRSYQAFSLGLGYHITRGVSLDVAYAHSRRTEQVYPFTGYRNKQGHLGLPDIRIKGGNMADVRNHLVATLTLSF